MEALRLHFDFLTAFADSVPCCAVWDLSGFSKNLSSFSGEGAVVRVLQPRGRANRSLTGNKQSTLVSVAFKQYCNYGQLARSAPSAITVVTN